MIPFNSRNKLNFEKRQQKTNANIQQMQRKLDKYQKTLKVCDHVLLDYLFRPR